MFSLNLTIKHCCCYLHDTKQLVQYLQFGSHSAIQGKQNCTKFGQANKHMRQPEGKHYLDLILKESPLSVITKKFVDKNLQCTIMEGSINDMT